LWLTSKAADDKWTPKPIAMDIVVAADEGGGAQSAYCLAVSPGHWRIISVGDDNNLLIHDINTILRILNFSV